MPENTPPQTNTDSGLKENIAGALAYSLGIFSGIFFLVTEKQNKFVRFHAFQSIMATIAAVVIQIFAQLIPTALGNLVETLVSIGILILWIYLMYQAYLGKTYKLPYIGDMAEQQLGK